MVDCLFSDYDHRRGGRRTQHNGDGTELRYQLSHAEVTVIVFEPQYRDRDFVAVLGEVQNKHGLDPLPKFLPVDTGHLRGLSHSKLPNWAPGLAMIC